MSIQAMAWAMEQQRVTDPSARFVLLMLANEADKYGRDAFPSVERIVKATGLSERTVRYKLDALEAEGVITRGNQAIVAAKIRDPRRRPVVYDLDMSWGAADAPQEVVGCNLRNLGVQPAQLRGAAVAPNPRATQQLPGESDARAPAPTPEGDACRRMRSAGCLTTNPRHVDLIAALDEGVTPETLEATAAEALAGGINARNAFAWAITTARNRHAAGPKPAAPSTRNPSHAATPRLSAAEQVRAAIAGRDQPADDLDGQCVRLA